LLNWSISCGVQILQQHIHAAASSGRCSLCYQGSCCLQELRDNADVLPAAAVAAASGVQVFVDEFTCIGCRNVSAAVCKDQLLLQQQQPAAVAEPVARPADAVRFQATAFAVATRGSKC
jgi:hypothetical protein